MIAKTAPAVLAAGMVAIVLSGCMVLPGPIAAGLEAAGAWHLATTGRSTSDLILSETLEADCVSARVLVGKPPCRAAEAATGAADQAPDE